MSPSGFTDKVIWTTTCIHGGTVSLYEDDWQGHVLVYHPEMAGQEDVVKRAVEDPKHLREGDYPDSRAFEIESATNPEGIRVFVRYEREMFVDGGIPGNVTTAYPINSKKYQSRVGPIIYTRPDTGKKK
jgi:hypothetical protein